VGGVMSATPVPLLTRANHTRSIVVASVTSSRVAAAAAVDAFAMTICASTWTLAEVTVRRTSSLSKNCSRSDDAKPFASNVATSPPSTKVATTIAL